VGLDGTLKDGAGSLEVDLTDAVLSSGLKLGLGILLRLYIGWSSWRICNCWLKLYPVENFRDH
jgi:hypothetical protein